MLTTTMDRPPCDPTLVRSSPFQARALHFLKKLALRARGSSKDLGDTIAPVAIPAQNFRHARSSLDLLRKPDISRLIGFRVEDSHNPMDTDDSSQDASASGNSPTLPRPRCYSALDSLRTAPIHSTFMGHATSPLFFRDQVGLGNKSFVHDSENVLTPAPTLRSTVSLNAVAQPLQSLVSSPEIAPQISASPEPQPGDQGVRDTPNDDVTPRPSADVLSSHNATPTTSFADQAPSTSSESGTPSRILTLPTMEDFIITLPERPPLLSYHSAPLPPPFCVTTERGLRLSPSIITRQPMPLLNLPVLPPPPPSPPDTLSRQNAHLRSMPSLPIHGRSNTGCQVDQVHASPEDSDEEEGDCDEEEEFNDALSGHQSDDDDDDDDNEAPGAGSPCIQSPKSLQKQRARDDEPPAESSASPLAPQNDVGPNLADCFSSETYVNSPNLAPLSLHLAAYSFSSEMPSADDIDWHTNLDPNLSKLGVRLESKPGLYRVASRSMVNLGSTRHTERGVRRLKSGETVRSNQMSASGHTTDSYAESEGSGPDAMIGRLTRRNSMPSFHPTSDPPPYPTFNPRPKDDHVTPHEDEGRERLPPYSNSLYLMAIMPRKMEFSSHGVQAKDRKWRRVVCELEGTTFRVYKCPPGASGGGVLGDWWEKRVGVGDMASPSPPRKRNKEEPHERPAKLEIDDSFPPPTPPPPSGRSTPVPPSRRRRESQSSMTTQHTMISTPKRAKRTSAASFLSPFRSSSSTRLEANAGESLPRSQSRELEILAVDMQDSRSLSSHESTGRATPVARRMSQPAQPRSASRLSFFPVTMGRAQHRNDEIYKPPQSDLLRAYTLQHAESGLGNDYVKRKNVVRVRLEGEQFLLQAPDIPSVVEWIEGLHAGTNIALDIDQRPMPRGPMFPRRRRRRARRTQAAEGTSGQRPQIPV